MTATVEAVNSNVETLIENLSEALQEKLIAEHQSDLIKMFMVDEDFSEEDAAWRIIDVINKSWTEDIAQFLTNAAHLGTVTDALPINVWKMILTNGIRQGLFDIDEECYFTLEEQTDMLNYYEELLDPDINDELYKTARKMDIALKKEAA